MSNKIHESLANMMSFLVNDLLDFSQLNAGKFRKISEEVNIKETVNEVISIMKEKAEMGGIELKATFKPQLVGHP